MGHCLKNHIDWTILATCYYYHVHPLKLVHGAIIVSSVLIQSPRRSVGNKKDLLHLSYAVAWLGGTCVPMLVFENAELHLGTA